VKPAVVAAVVAAGVVMLSRRTNIARYRPAKNTPADIAVEQLRQLGVLMSEPNPAGLVRVRSKLGGVTYRYLGTDRGSETMDPRLALLLYRVGELARSRGVTEIDHLGIHPGAKSDPGDVHNRGLAADLAVFHGPGARLSVLDDWGMRKKEGPGYRLRPGDTGYQFFQDVYDLLRREGEGGGSIGEHSFVLTPDHPDVKYSSTHKDHFHVQVEH